MRVWQRSELPAGVSFEEVRSAFRHFNEAGYVEDMDTWRHWYECRHCGGWVEGYANRYSVNTMDSSRLSGRRGTEYYCRRCGEQIGFIGMMS